MKPSISARLFGGGAFALCLAVFAGLVGGLVGVWPLELFASLLPQLALAALVLAALGGWLRRARRTPLILAAAAALAFWGAREQFQPPSAEVSEPDVRVIWANMGNERDERSLARLMDLAESAQADVVIASEFPARLEEAEIRRASEDVFPHRYGRLAGARTNIVVFARRPLEVSGSLSERWNSGFLFRIGGEDGGGLAIAATHTPTPLLPGNMTRRDEIVREAAEALAAEAANGGGGLLVGDFNAVSWSALLRSLKEGSLGEGGAGGQRVSYGWRASWRSSLPFLGLPIDHAVTFGAARASVQVGEDIGSDHFPLVVSVAFGESSTEE